MEFELRCPIFIQVAHFCRELFNRGKSGSGLLSQKVREKPRPVRPSMTVIPRDAHNISRKHISNSALKVLYRLNKSGYEAYLVGGSVRDLLLGKMPKDFDVATNATPDQVHKLFRNCRLVGRRFRLAHVIFGQEVIEVATFRGHHQTSGEHHGTEQDQNGKLLRDNIFGRIEEDAQRRDLTINSLYYSVADFSVRDYIGGLQDLRAGVIRLIGDPETRYREDPVRMLRVIRFSCKLDMPIAEETAEPILRLAVLLKDIPPARLYEEALKLFLTGRGYDAYVMLRRYKLFEHLFPLISQGDDNLEKLILRLLKDTDSRVERQEPINVEVFFASLLWYPMQEKADKIVRESDLFWHEAVLLAMNELMSEVCRSLAIPRRISAPIREILMLQYRFSRSRGKRAQMLTTHPKFRAACWLLRCRAEIEKDKALSQLANFWIKCQVAGSTHKQDNGNSFKPAFAFHQRRRPRGRTTEGNRADV